MKTPKFTDVDVSALMHILRMEREYNHTSQRERDAADRLMMIVTNARWEPEEPSDMDLFCYMQSAENA